MRCIALASVLVGCPSDDTVAPDAPVEQNGLIVDWSSQPAAWPSDLGDAVTLERASFAIDSLRVIGDAGPGDPRTTKVTFEVRWDESSQPSDVLFSDAPPGLYSQVSIVLDGHSSDAFEIRGRAYINGNDWEYRIEDTTPLGFTIPIDKVLSPGDLVTLAVHVDFVHALDSIDFSTLRIDEGHLELESTDTQMPVFRQKLVESFVFVSSGEG